MTTEDPAGSPVLPARRPFPLRFHLLVRSMWMMLTSLAGAVLFSVWITVVAVSPITVFAPLLEPTTAMVRDYANAHRRSTSRLLGTPIPAPYRPTAQDGRLARAWTILRDPASWRDALWLLLHSIVGCLTSALAVALFAYSWFYLIYPVLFWVSPWSIFDAPFGGWFELHSVAGAMVMMPFALASFGLWLVLQVPLTRAELTLTRSLLGQRTLTP